MSNCSFNTCLPCRSACCPPCAFGNACTVTQRTGGRGAVSRTRASTLGTRSPRRGRGRARAHARGGGMRPSAAIASGSRGSSAGASGQSAGAKASAQLRQHPRLKGLWKRPVESWRYLYLWGEGGVGGVKGCGARARRGSRKGAAGRGPVAVGQPPRRARAARARRAPVPVGELVRRYVARDLARLRRGKHRHRNRDKRVDDDKAYDPPEAVRPKAGGDVRARREDRAAEGGEQRVQLQPQEGEEGVAVELAHSVAHLATRGGGRGGRDVREGEG